MSTRQERIHQDITRPKTQRLVTPKKARKVFREEIERLAKDAYVKVLKRRILIWIIIGVSTTIITNLCWAVCVFGFNKVFK